MPFECHLEDRELLVFVLLPPAQHLITTLCCPSTFTMLMATSLITMSQNIWIVQNSDTDLMTSCFTCIFIGAMLPARFHDVTVIFGKKFCRSSQRAQQEIQEQFTNTEEQELRAMPN